MKYLYTERYIDAYLGYLSKYRTIIDEQLTSYGNMYDFEVEHKLVERCEAGEILTVDYQPTRDNE